MADRLSGILEKLIAAIETVNEILDQEVASNVRKHALRELCAALQQVVDYDNLWQALYECASGKSSFAGIPDTKAFLEPVADALCDTLARLLLKCGYRSPPPPQAHVLIEQTRKSVLAEHRESRWGTAHIEDAREGLTIFVRETIQHIKDANPAWLSRIRTTAISAALMMLLSQAEIKSGDSFSVDFSASVTDLMTVEITFLCHGQRGR